MMIDTHAHVNFKVYKEDAQEVIQRALDKQIFVINVGSQYSTSARAVEIANKYDSGVYACVGIHPLHLQKMSFMHKDDDELEETEISTRGEDFDYEKYLKLVQKEKVVAIGEVGLDYHHFEDRDDKEKLIQKQKEIFLEFIKLANVVKKPLMIHCWDAYQDLLEILENNPVEKKGVIHSFVGSYKTAKKFIELGYKIGLNGIITYGISYDRLIKEIDLEDILMETDCPYLGPVPKKGDRNEPIYVKYIAEKIADVKGIDVQKVAEITTKNAKKLFNI